LYRLLMVMTANFPSFAHSLSRLIKSKVAFSVLHLLYERFV
jgi:hypothetical protein